MAKKFFEKKNQNCDHISKKRSVPGRDRDPGQFADPCFKVLFINIFRKYFFLSMGIPAWVPMRPPARSGEKAVSHSFIGKAGIFEQIQSEQRIVQGKRFFHRWILQLKQPRSPRPQASDSTPA